MHRLTDMSQQHATTAITFQAQFIQGVTVVVKVNTNSIKGYICECVRACRARRMLVVVVVVVNVLLPPPPCRILPFGKVGLQQTQIRFPFITNHLAASKTTNRNNHGKKKRKKRATTSNYNGGGDRFSIHQTRRILVDCECRVWLLPQRTFVGETWIPLVTPLVDEKGHHRVDLSPARGGFFVYLAVDFLYTFRLELEFDALSKNGTFLIITTGKISILTLNSLFIKTFWRAGNDHGGGARQQAHPQTKILCVYCGSLARSHSLLDY